MADKDILSRSEEIKLSFCCCNNLNQPCHECTYSGKNDKEHHCWGYLAIDVLALIEAQAARIAELEAGRRPIPVTERLPEEHGTYLVFRDIGGGLFEWDHSGMARTLAWGAVGDIHHPLDAAAGAAGGGRDG